MTGRVKATTIAADTASPYRNETPTMNRPSRAMHTVTPAKMTARPEVLMERTVEASTSMPRRRLARWRLTMKSA